MNPEQQLDAGTQPPKGVASPSSLTVYVGDPPRQLQIFSGVAVVEWKSEEDLDREDVLVRLGATTTETFSWTAHAGLASISNEDSDFVFALDAVSVEVDAVDRVLRLRVPIAVQGEPAVLHRFSYTVHVLSDPIVAKITGHISWARSWGDPTFAVTRNRAAMFRVSVGHTQSVPGPAGGFAQTKFVEQVAGFSTPPIASEDRWIAAYEVDNVPLGRLWEVRPALLAGALNGPPHPFLTNPGFQPFPQRVQLSKAQPSASGVDFSMTFSQDPR